MAFDEYRFTVGKTREGQGPGFCSNLSRDVKLLSVMLSCYVMQFFVFTRKRPLVFVRNAGQSTYHISEFYLSDPMGEARFRAERIATRCSSGCLG